MSYDLILGYSFTFVVTVALILLISSIIIGRKEIISELKGISKRSLLALLLIILFFLFIALRYVTAFEELYFDENIYQGIALNILKHGLMLWCEMGTGYLNSCYHSVLYHDPVGWSYFLAIAFALFGIGTGTAYGTELFAGTLGVFTFFFFAYILTRREDIATTSTLIFAMMPEFLIWSRTQADPDLPFMSFSIITFFFFTLFMRRKKISTLIMFLSSLLITLYIRTEAILLLGVFFLLLFVFDYEGIGSIKKKAKDLYNILNTNPKITFIALVFFILMVPQLIYMGIEASTQSYGQPSNQSAISLSYFPNNFVTNLNYLLGSYNYVAYFPAVFPPFSFFFAIIGAILIFFQKWSKKMKFEIFFTLFLWFIAYFIFYALFYAGSALFGVDSRFMLQITPEISLLAGIGVILASLYFSKIIGWISLKLKHKKQADENEPYQLAINSNQNIESSKRKNSKNNIIFYSSVAILFAIFFAYPFANLFNLITLNVNEMPQQSVIAPTIEFFYHNYQKVPANCLVFSFTPDIWFEVGRASMQIGYLGSGNSTIASIEKNFSCYVLDYGYWCMVNPYNTTLCLYDKDSYKIKALAIGSVSFFNGEHPAFYLLENYSPS
ncbi:MAG: hypothetical protein RXR32_02150 [Candidatus Micrarchaeota archaeon]